MDGIRSSHNNLRSSIRRSFSNTHTAVEDVFAAGTSRSSRAREDDEEALKWAAIEKLPTYDRLRTSIIKSLVENDDDDDGVRHDAAGSREVDVRKLDMDDRLRFINAVFKVAEDDNEKFLKRFKNRLDRVGIQLPRVEVRYEHLNVEAETYVGSRALPTLVNTAQNIAELSLGMLGIRLSNKTQFCILKDISGIIKPSRMTLLLGPPSSGKTTLLLALAGRLDSNLKVIIEIPYVLAQSLYYTLIVYAMIKFKWTAKKFFWAFFVNFCTFLYFTYYGMMAVAISPNVQVAAILAASFYALFNLFSGFFIPRPRIPPWWIWYYWICPLAWTMYGLITSQYGDDERTIKVAGMEPDPTIKWYLEHHFGYHYDFMRVVAAVLVAFPVFFAFLFGLCTKLLNFQVR